MNILKEFFFDVVVSGVSGRFPKSKNFHEFASNLFDKVDMTDNNDDRWKQAVEFVVPKSGKISDLDKFDGAFFSLMNKQAKFTDPLMRISLEHVYEAILDAGISPQSLIGSRTGVFVACSNSDAREYYNEHPNIAPDGMNFNQNAQFHFANRISYIFGLCGPSFVVDTACSSSGSAIDAAHRFIKSGACDAAIVAGCNSTLSFNIFREFKAAGITSLDGISKPFDADASGFTRAETVCAVFLQKRQDAKRIYAEIVHTLANNDGFKKEGSALPSKELQQKLMENFYRDIEFNPNEIKIVEAHATSTKGGDFQEVSAIDEVFCKNRSDKLVIGSVKSNMGHAEAASGMSSLSKILIAFETGKFPPNINLKNLRNDISAFNENRIEVATEAIDLTSPFIAMNSFGIGGSNVHILFKQHLKEKILTTDEIERMILWSGRTEEAVQAIFDDITSRPLDVEHIALLQNSQIITPDANSYRGFGIFKSGNDTATCTTSKINNFDGIRRPIVFVYAGVGTQWAGMGRDLMKIPIFAESIDKCHEILLRSKNFDLKSILMSTDENIYDNYLFAFVAIIVIEIALTDVLKALGIKPDFIIGHSLGEVSCAYADGCLNTEEVLEVVYMRTKVVHDLNISGGAMAAVHMDVTELENILPHSIDIACYNSENMLTISGLKAEVDEFIQQLKKVGRYAKEVDCAGIPFHSHLIGNVAIILKEKLKQGQLIANERSKKWLTTTFAEECEESRFYDANYQVSNLSNPVHFKHAVNRLPQNAITIDIAPHGFMKSLFKSLKQNSHVSLTNKYQSDVSEYFMTALGELFKLGVDFDISKLYPAVEFPVSRGTAMISPIIKWNHNESHFVPRFEHFFRYERLHATLNFESKELKFVDDHMIDGKIIVPFTFWIYFVWKNFAFMNGMHYENMKVEIKDMEMLRATYAVPNKEIQITLNIQRGSGRFEIMEENSAILRGTILHDKDIKVERISKTTSKENMVTLKREDFYRQARILGFHYLNSFQGVHEISDDDSRGKIQWNINWVTFLDNVLQVILFNKKLQRLELPSSIKRILIDPILHKQILNEEKKDDSNILLNFMTNHKLKSGTCGGVEICDISTVIANRKQQTDILVDTCKFFSYFDDCVEYEVDDALMILFTISAENSLKTNYSLVEIINSIDEKIASKSLLSAQQRHPILIDVKLFAQSVLDIEDVEVIVNENMTTLKNIDIILAKNCSLNEEFLRSIKDNLNSAGVLITEEKSNSHFFNDGLQIVSRLKLKNGNELLLVKLKHIERKNDPKVIKITSRVTEWLEKLKKELKNMSEEQNNEKFDSILLLSQNDDCLGLLGFYNCLRFEYLDITIKCVIIDDENAPIFDLNDKFYAEQLSKGHAINILKDGKWGTYVHYPLRQDESLKSYKEACFANYSIRGNVNSIKWHQKTFNDSNDLIRVQYAALNFKDVVYAYGQLPDDTNLLKECAIGLEFTGIRVKTGERIFGMCSTGGCLASYINESDVTTYSVPDFMTLEEAATIPIVYTTVYYAFFISTTIEPGKSILIHSGAGGVGQAAIQTAFAYGLDVFTTVGTEEKQKFLLEQFPQLKAENIGNSRDTSFLEMIMERTDGKGVDYVLNSLTGDKMIASLECLAQNGVFLEIGKINEAQDLKCNFKFMEKNISLKLVALDSSSVVINLMNAVKKLKIDIIRGLVKPINRTVFDAADIVQAFRYMSTGNHIGKVLIKMREHENDIGTLPINVRPRFYCNPEHSYIVVGGLGGLGLEFSQWLIGRKCRKLVLTSTRGVSNQYQAFKIKYWKSFGVEVVINTSDATSQEGCEELIKTAAKLGQIGGIFNFAAVIKDGAFENQTVENFEASMAPKVLITQHLHDLSLKYCPDLKYFVVTSSVSSGRGAPGQTNYGYSNSIMERIIEKRHKLGLPAKAIQWGPITDVGLFAELEVKYKQLLKADVPLLSLTSFLEKHDQLLTCPDPIVTCSALFKITSKTNEKESFVDKLMKILNITDKKTISMSSTFSQLGIDSLSGVELQQMIEREYSVTLTSFEIRNLSIIELEAKTMQRDKKDMK